MFQAVFPTCCRALLIVLLSLGATAAVAQDFPITIDHAFGQTVIAQRPERVATVAWANHEVPLALGVVPVGFAAAGFGDEDGDGLLPWVAARVDDLGADTPPLFDEGDGIDFEAVAATQPDVILAAYSGLSRSDYDTLSMIAPVVAYPASPWSTSATTGSPPAWASTSPSIRVKGTPFSSNNSRDDTPSTNGCLPSTWAMEELTAPSRYEIPKCVASSLTSRQSSLGSNGAL